MPEMTSEDGVDVLVRRATSRGGRVVLIVGNDAAQLTPAQASQLAVYLTTVADIVNITTQQEEDA